ncbi:MAG: GatB/YqeY domain-containing protein [Deltaproteobacteria bacterium]|nr:GatB/YqeY domain-containing protein [Deltaproteobacteria bacterium]MBI3294760.1 GatB/YqeY domain-containing protein [Deltaproteobacteria bacterium]
MKAQDALTVSTLRMLISDVKKREIDSRATLSDTDIQKVVSTLIKQRNDSIEAFNKGGRMDLSEKEAKEIEILKKYLPQQMSKEAVDQLVAECILEAGAKDPKDMGKVMKLVVAKAAGRADGRILNEAVRTQLSKSSS